MDNILFNFCYVKDSISHFDQNISITSFGNRYDDQFILDINTASSCKT